MVNPYPNPNYNSSLVLIKYYWKLKSNYNPNLYTYWNMTKIWILVVIVTNKQFTSKYFLIQIQ